MPQAPFNFTKKGLERLVPYRTAQTYHDQKVVGLKLLVYPSGIKTFIVYRKVFGQPERIKLGRFPELSVEQARKKAQEVNTQIACGLNPNDTRREQHAEMNLKEYFDYFIEHHAKVHKKTWKENVDQFRRYLSHLSKRKISRLGRNEIQKLHAQLGREKGIYTANRLLELLSVMYTKAVEWGFVQQHPVKGIKKFKEKARDRFIQSDELPRFFESLDQEPNAKIRDYILISLLTGARKSNVLAMRWEEVNLERATWQIPETKNGEAHTVPLVPAAIDILRRRYNTDSEWVFPGSGAIGHLADPKKGWKRVLDRANLKDLRLHDLRRSLGSWQAATGASLSVIGKTLAHKNVSTTAIYARLNLDPVRASMEKATEAILSAARI